MEDFLDRPTVYTSQISLPEVVGFTKITEEEVVFFNAFFAHTQMLMVDRATLEEAARLRQIKKLSLGNAIIAATAIVHGLTLVTANTKDFKKFPELTLINPLEV